MDITTAALYLQAGYRLTRQHWLSTTQEWIDQHTLAEYKFSVEDLLTNDWEVDRRNLVEELVPKYSFSSKEEDYVF